MHAFTTDDLARLRTVGMSAEQAAAQLTRLRMGARPLHLVRPATLGDGIEALADDRRAALMAHGQAAAGRVTIFVPASGAATRMFKDLIAALEDPRPLSDSPAVREFVSRLHEFPFAEELRRRMPVQGWADTEAERRALLQTVLVDMRLGSLPKALMPFHRSSRVRTAFEEHLLEATRYACGPDGVVRLHFTIAADAVDLFEEALTQVRASIESQRPGTHLSVHFSTQSPSTDTLALDEHGHPFRAPDGSLLLRPAGHGALLGNLEQSGGDIVVMKNIDNILPEERGEEVVRWKRLLIGYLAQLQSEVFAHLRAVSQDHPTRAALDAARVFAADRLARPLPPTADRDAIVGALHRPLRVCGVVRTTGEPGGAPFWVRDEHGETSLQIVEPPQVAMTDPDQAAIFRSATHFNPVDVVCALRGYDGTPFDLSLYVDPDSAFVTTKTAGGRTLTALERPGLWNGSMAGWNTVLVEVPASTFAPVKTVFDLLRPEHRSDTTAP